MPHDNDIQMAVSAASSGTTTATGVHSPSPTPTTVATPGSTVAIAVASTTCTVGVVSSAFWTKLGEPVADPAKNKPRGACQKPAAEFKPALVTR